MPSPTDWVAALIAILAATSRCAPELANERTSSAARAVQRPSSTQNAAIGMRPDFAGSNMLTVSARSCLPPLTKSPD